MYVNILQKDRILALILRSGEGIYIKVVKVVKITAIPYVGFEEFKVVIA